MLFFSKEPRGYTMYIDIEKKVNTIKQSLKTELQKTNAIDAQNRVIDATKFTAIVQSKLKEMEQLEPLAFDINGTATDRYGANIILKGIHKIECILQNKSLTPDHDELNRQMNTAEKDEYERILTRKNFWNKIFHNRIKNKTK